MLRSEIFKCESTSSGLVNVGSELQKPLWNCYFSFCATIKFIVITNSLWNNITFYKVLFHYCLMVWGCNNYDLLLLELNLIILQCLSTAWEKKQSVLFFQTRIPFRNGYKFISTLWEVPNNLKCSFLSFNMYDSFILNQVFHI